MNPLILFETKEKYINFEANRIKKSLIYCLRMYNERYVSSTYDETYDLVHYVLVSDIARYSEEIKKNTKIVLSLLSSEEDYKGRLLKKVRAKDEIEKYEYIVSKSDIELINKVDLVLTPSKKASEFLISQGVKTNIKEFMIPVRTSNFDLKNSVLKNAVYRYLSLPEDSIIGFATLHNEDYEGYQKIKELAISYPKIKFIAISHVNIFSGLSLKFKRLFKDKPSNLILTTPLNEDIYCSLLYNSKFFINVASSYGNDQASLEAMASKTQIFALKTSVFPDIVIDNETGYIYNDIDSLKKGFGLYLDGLLEDTTHKAYKFAKEVNLVNCGEKLIKIYKELLEE